MFLSVDRLVRFLHLRTRSRERQKPEPMPIDRSVAETLGYVAHELRQPLCAALAALRVIRSTEHEARRMHATTVVDRQLHRIDRLIDDLMDTTRLRVRQPSLHIAHIDVRRTAQEVVDAVTPQAVAKHQHLEVTVPKDPLFIDADWVRLQQVLSNLITNAIEYTEPDGSIRVSVERRGSEALLTVADTGQGMSPELLQRVFEPFVQGGSGSPRGLGVGLAVARQLVELHRGRIRVESSGPGNGSTFIVSIPVATKQTCSTPRC
jgi:signal transduction histidine kinase